MPVLWLCGHHARLDPCSEPMPCARCSGGRSRRCGYGALISSRCWHSGVNAAFCTLFNGSDGIHLAYAAYFGPFSPRFNLHCSILGHFHQYSHLLPAVASILSPLKMNFRLVGFSRASVMGLGTRSAVPDKVDCSRACTRHQILQPHRVHHGRLRGRHPGHVPIA